MKHAPRPVEDVSISIAGGFLVPATDQVASKRIQETGRLDFDYELLAQLTPHIPPGGFAIDCGACIGTHALFYSNCVGSTGLVLAIEPCALNYAYLKNNVDNFPRENVIIQRCGVSHRSFQALVHYEELNVGETSLEENEGGDVRVYALDQLVPSVSTRSVSFIKFDVEGWELMALIGAQNILREYRPALLVEVNPLAMARVGVTMKALEAFLEMFNYAFTALQDMNTVPAGGVFDLICTPQTPS